MPITPFHFGPGLLIKVGFPNRFNFRAFILSQIVMDIEVIWNIWQGNERLHTVFHSYLGALIAGFIAFGLFRSIERAANAFRVWRSTPPPTLNLIISILIGVWSHVLLDSFMHPDLEPFAPLWHGNPFLDFVGLKALHIACLACGLLGFLMMGRLRTGPKP